MIKVCDAIMGTGKSSAAINYINDNPDEKFIYITPYLEEAKRIKNGCPKLKFVEPNNFDKESNHKKSEHTAKLIKQGRNITTTHQCFMRYTEDMLNDIKKYGYRLIIDENIDIIATYELHPDDAQVALYAGLIKENGDYYELANKNYHGTMFRELCQFLKTRQLIRMEDEKYGNLYYWIMPPDLLTSFKEVIVLTYLFKGQTIHHFLHIYNIPYEYIGIAKTERGYVFSDYPGYTPDYVYKIKDMVKIIDNPKLNAIGDDYFALSMNWFDKNEEGLSRLKKNVYNIVNNIWSGIDSKEKLIGTYKDAVDKLKGKGYTKSFLNFNTKATNAYRKRKYLIYATNIFMNVREKTFYEKNGISVDEEQYSLSIMVQWIWRSAIRDGDTIQLYIPSKRMRTILTDWMNDLEKGGNKIYEENM